MAKKGSRGRNKPENPRKYKKKTSPLIIEGVEYVDYKDVDLLSRFMSDRGKIRNMKVTGNDRQQQLEVAHAIKIAREMALLPYAKRVASAPRGGRRDDRRGQREDKNAPEQAPAEEVEETPTDDAVEAVAAPETPAVPETPESEG
ncbi:MAG: 30S ribosomal protein S18 [Ilumatobacter coccineus]|uniref:Small ribosomal subunit protein bS18 n=1 Tax=Ilumatobacter coccineus TaxID=467094 RepID=A0A2G6K7Y5_9ACTN|nr:MAG: 30S ribosomal protein S18 [Ilumatobacter coccineus]